MTRFRSRIAQSICLLPLVLAGCHVSITGVSGSGVSKTEDRDVGEINAIKASGSNVLKIQCGADPKLEVTSDDNLLELISTQNENGTLSIGQTESFNATIRPTFDIGTRTISGVEVSGSGDVTISNYDDDELKLHVSGSGKFRVSGRCKSVDVQISGSGNADLTGLVALHAHIGVSGSGKASVHAVETLKVDVAGSGNVKYIGDPKVQQSIAGSGRVTQMEAPPAAMPAERDDPTATPPAGT